MSTNVEQREFQAEARQLLDLMIHSIYSNKDTFLRELVSNASDALDKLRLESFHDKDLQVDTSDLHIDLEVDTDKRTLTVRDNGIGMSRDEVIDLIGTLAKSGTGELRRKLKEAKDAAASEELIGQFGIGFYSAFMVADNVTLVTRRAGEDTGTRWESGGESTYTIATVEDVPQAPPSPCTSSPRTPTTTSSTTRPPAKLREIVKKYSDFIAWPIRMEIERTKTAPAEDGGEPIVETVVETETLNSGKALWARSRDEVSDDEYKEFYRHVAHAWDDPLEIIPMKAEGTFEYQALLFIPSQAPFDLFQREHRSGVQLYVKRVFIMDDCEELMPEYLRFVKGVVDAQDLSLNVSREILQQDRQIRAIRRRLTKKVLSTIKDLLAGDRDRYRTFWAEFGRVVKEGLISDTDNRETLLALSSFDSTESTESQTTLAEYVERMKVGQEDIFYLTGESRQQLENSPHMERSAPRASRCCCSPTGGRGVGVVGAGVRRQAAALDRQGRGGSRQRGREEGRRGRPGGEGEGLRGSARMAEGRSRRTHQGGAAVVAADDVPGVHRRRHVQHVARPRTHVPGVGSGVAADEAHPRAEPPAIHW